MTDIKWVKLKKYCEMTGETKDSVHGKRRKGIWLDGRECMVGPDGNLWINLEAVEQWLMSAKRNLHFHAG